MDHTRITQKDLATTLRVLEAAAELNQDSPEAQQLRKALSGLYKQWKKARRQEAKQERRNADEQILRRTATASANRVDDETAGLLISPLGQKPVALEAGAVATPHGFAGKLRKAQNCYVCKKPYTLVDSFHHQLCPDCAADNRLRREASVDLSGRRALLTGGRAKIGMYIALKLLRDGADLTITTRFPADAARRFAAVADSSEWLHRLNVVGIDLRNPARVAEFAEDFAKAPVDILINNAAQTVRRSPGAYSGLIDAEQAALTGAAAEVKVLSYGPTHNLHPQQLESATAAQRWVDESMLALQAGAHTEQTVDAGGLIPDLVSHNSWVAKVGEVDPIEMLEVQLCNATAPFILLNRLRPALIAAKARRKYVVNVSAMEGVFGRGYKGPGHPHTNMAKAALNMLTRTVAGELVEHGVLVTAVDTGWITDERPHTTKQRLHKEGFRAPLDLVDGAARVYDPIVQGENGVDLYGCFLKDYRPHPW
ncbi:SDR family oxidoreductase [Corynebacterium sp. 153RC1]|uniref:SDR family oxidoreductase n=1 Tax=unclassified Corynebacterium TaxID=2624378 RepID=UPI00211B9233|nr:MULTISPECIES: SDR family oxidoreductase [unclassified Corynebacterium]MCQ9369760.1 SDR family oxidoreductase [Corynebacterium sp. 35RC1]MCQ9352419.1 SDR family oxidoreductase [Corynebacterium sp. 209RC1]MCQ9354409.1 SDR family oxidoreductase [Corynebacterium sp. 1222RC1]MCQ9356702.1 SDR family oxidoreductase [Corynebacterium sp. 122RC1]MCQ9358804.1 SDR family oxidoreductase [Corynebacterium sp. 142RC1]